MGRAPCCDKANVKKGPWSPEEDTKLKEYIDKYGTGGNWIALPQKAGLKRCGKSCRLRWLNYLRPNIKHGEFTEEEDRIICTLFASIGSRWSIIAAQLPGRTDNDIKNYWNTKLKKKLLGNMVINQLNNTKQQPNYPPQPVQLLQTPHSSQLLLPSLPFSVPLYNSYNNYNPCLVQTPQESLLLSPMQCYYPPLKENNMLVFGGDQASCSSSDGSCSLGKEIKQEDMGIIQGYNAISSNGYNEENQKFMLDNYEGNNSINGVGGVHNVHHQSLIMSSGAWSTTTADHQKSNGYFGNYSTSLECDLEEVKQLICNGGTTATGNNSNSFFCFNDESKTQERTMYNYY